MQIALFENSNKTRITEVLFFSFLPVLFCFITLLYFGFDLRDFAPYYSDELHYWNEINSLSAVGFDGGYSVINETPSKFHISPFGPHGPGFPVIGGVYSLFFGWRLYSPLILNSLVLSLSLFAFFWTVPINRIQRLLISGFLTTSFFVFNFLATGMQETVNQSIGILLALLIVKIIGCRTSNSVPNCVWKSKNFTFFLIVTFTVVRASWGVIFAAVVLFLGRRGSRPYQQVFSSILLLFVSVTVITCIYSPVTKIGQIDLFVDYVLTGNIESFRSFVATVTNNIRSFWGLGRGVGFIEALLRYELTALIIYLVYLVGITKNKTNLSKDQKLIGWISLSILLTSITLVILFYEVGSWRDYRVLAPSFICVFLLITCNGKHLKFLSLLLLLQISVLPLVVPTFTGFRRLNFLGTTTKEHRLEETINASVVYSPDVNRWCNTMLLFSPGVSDNRINRMLWRPEAGIAISVVHDLESLVLPIQSKYIFFSKKGRDMFLLKGGQVDHLSPMVDVGAKGIIYENYGSKCKFEGTNN
ncbi:MAG: hypothetical protein COA36_01445 [Desulfotalea sp.]|nr:MAG: hypothetical protein COA36_01445 [Desulfotalea sp.]